MEKLTKLPEDVLEAVSSESRSGSKSRSSKPAAVETEDAVLADDESELKISFTSTLHVPHQSGASSPSFPPFSYSDLGCYFSWRFPLSSPFLKVFPSIYPLLRFVSWNLTTRCLAVTDGGNVDQCDRLSQPSWLLGTV